MMVYMCIGCVCLLVGATVGFFAAALLGGRGQVSADGVEKVTFEYKDGRKETYRARG
jgi:hypothetical protein